MSIIKVQCQGSGKEAKSGINAKRAVCGYCHHMQDVRPDGRFRKHMRITRTARLK